MPTTALLALATALASTGEVVTERIFVDDAGQTLPDTHVVVRISWQAADPEAPVWGEAETWFFIGQLHQEAGDQVAARAALEKALAIAPDYRAASDALAALG